MCVNVCVCGTTIGQQEAIMTWLLVMVIKAQVQMVIKEQEIFP
jgi:hypothetical protein